MKLEIKLHGISSPPLLKLAINGYHGYSRISFEQCISWYDRDVKRIKDYFDYFNKGWGQ